MKRIAIGIGPLSLVLAACTSTGTGTGFLRNDTEARVHFEWQGIGTGSGTLTARFQDGREFAGRFFQVTRLAQIDHPATAWVCWPPEWSVWASWYQDAGPEFVRHYSGRVLANLDGPGGASMSCRFQLVRPSSGLQGGGHGSCELSGGDVVHVEFSTP